MSENIYVTRVSHSMIKKRKVSFIESTNHALVCVSPRVESTRLTVFSVSHKCSSGLKPTMGHLWSCCDEHRSVASPGQGEVASPGQ